MHSSAQNLSEKEREQIFFLLMKKLEQDLEVRIKVKISLSEDNKIVPILYVIADGNINNSRDTS